MPEANVRAIAAAARRSHRALCIESLTRNLENYFVALGAPKGHVFTLQDINLQVMMNVFAPEERALLDVVIEALVLDGGLRRVSATGYVLTDEGLGRVSRLRSHPGVDGAAPDRRARRAGGGLRGVGESLPGNGSVAKPSA
jgi:hypothetical protein